MKYRYTLTVGLCWFILGYYSRSVCILSLTDVVEVEMIIIIIILNNI